VNAPLQDGMADVRDQPREQRDVVMQRVRVGITGLAAVFLLTLLAASIFSFLGQDEHGTKLANGAVVGNTQAAADVPKEPLAELGVAPGANPKPAPAMPPAQITGNPPMVTLYPPAPVLNGQHPANPSGQQAQPASRQH
jgi:hypothetical protein